jgi:hypothetical protein
MVDKYQGDERRHTGWGCPLHEQVVRDFDLGGRRMERYEEKIDDLIKGQNAQSLLVQGLTSDMRQGMSLIQTMDGRLNDLCSKYDAKLCTHEDKIKEFDKFSWFREWMNKLRTNFFEYIMTIALASALILIATHFGDQIIKKVFG